MSAEQMIASLGLLPHPEGGHYREVFRSELVVTSAAHVAPRSASTAIYFLLRSAEFSAFHRVRSDELWHHYRGDSIELHLLTESGSTELRIGPDFERGDRPLGVVPAGTLQAARVAAGTYGYALCGCTVAPGFDFADFEMPSRAELKQSFPAQSSLIDSLTR